MTSDRNLGERHAKRVMVFISEDNPLWHRLAMFERRCQTVISTKALKPGMGKSATKPPSKRYQLLGISRTKFDDWRDGNLAVEASAYQQIQALADAISVTVRGRDDLAREAQAMVDTITLFLASAEADEPVQSAGRALGYLDADAMRMALDKAFDRLHPLFRLPYMTKNVGIKELKWIKGRHEAWMRRGPDLFLHCFIEFRYVCELSKKNHCIRVRMDVPMINPTTSGETASDAIYEGWVMIAQNSRLFVCLEARQRDSTADCVFLVIDKRGTDGWRSGRYLTAGQDNSGLPASGMVLMRAVQDAQSPGGTPERIIRPGGEAFAELQLRSDRLEAVNTN